MTPSQPALLRELQNDQRWLVTISRRLLAQESDAEDIAQEASLRALEERAGRRVVPERDARPWLVQTVKRLAWNANRRHSHRAGATSSATPLEDVGDDGQQAPVDALARAEFRKVVAALVMELPELERQTLVLRFYEDLGTTEIMEATGAPSKEAVRQRLSRGIRRLRERLDSRQDAVDWRPAALLLSGSVSSKGVASSVAPTGWALFAFSAIGAIGAVLAGLGWSSGDDELSGVPDTLAIVGEAVPQGADLSVEAAPRVRLDRAVTVSRVDEAAGLGEATEVVVVLKDRASGQRLVGQPWFLIQTGENDYGRAWGFAAAVPNPEPIARGVTDAAGAARFSLPGDALVNLVTERTDQHARGSWPIRIEDGAAQPEEVLLSQGTTFRGRVVDDRGEPCPGLILVSMTYFDEWLRLGSTDAEGRFETQRCADFPRSFVIREDDAVESTRRLRTEVRIMSAADFARADASLDAGVRVALHARGRSEVGVEDIVFPRGATVEGRVFDEGGRPVAGALVSAVGTATTDEEGRYRLSIPARALRREGMRLTATSLEAGSSALELVDLRPGTLRQGGDFVLDGSGDVRILFTDASGGLRPFERAAAAEWGAKLLWDTDLEGAVGGETEARLLETADGGLVSLSALQLPSPDQFQGTPRGTAFVPGFRATRFELPTGADEIDVALQPLPNAHFQLFVSGAAARHFVQAKVTITAEPPEPRLSPANVPSKVTAPHLVRTVAYDWKNGEARALDLAAGSGFYLYVTLFPGPARAPRVLPVQGPIDLAEATAEAPFLIEAAVHRWPERARLDRAFEDGVASVALNARRPTTIVARVVDHDSHEFIDGAIVRSVNERHHHHSTQRIQGGAERTLCLEASMNQVTLRFAARGYRPMELGPMALIPGEELQLGDVALEPLRQVNCRLVTPDGAAMRGVRPLSWSDPVTGPVRMATSAAGEVDFFIGASLPTAIEVQRRSGSRAPVQLVQPQWSQEAGGRDCVLVVHRWRPVRLRLQGLGLVWRHGVSHVLVEDAVRSSGDLSGVVECGAAHVSGEDVLVDLQLPPGTWAISPSAPRFITFPHVEVAMDASQRTSAQDPLEFVVAARLGDDVPR